MRGKTVFASMVTLTFMFGFVFTTFMAIAIASNQTALAPALLLAITVTVGWAALVWLVSPFFMDLMQRWLYSARELPIEELRSERPAVAAFVEEVAQRHGIKLPRLKLIDDQTPQAYCYGSHGNNARLVTTRGMMNYLNDEELKAVYGHELGHIVHRDFIVMTIAGTLLNVLWTIYVVSRNIKGKNNSRPAMPIAIAALAFWWISQYLLLFLSRTREYYADEFAGQETGNPNALSMALVKIAYGLTQMQQTEFSRKLLGGTRAMGITDFKSAKVTGLAYKSLNHQASARYASAGAAAVAVPADADVQAPPMNVSVSLEGVRRIEKVMLFDLYNPWATVSEIGSTHPLTGKRIRALSQQAVEQGKPALLSLDPVDAFGQPIDKSRMYGTFALEVGIYYAPQILGAAGVVLSIVSALAGHGSASAGLILCGVGLGLTVRGFYRFGPLGDAPPPATVFELMSDPYASPLRGRPVLLEGTVIGRLDAGNKLSEDVMIEDREGGLMGINYESAFGPLGNWWFATRRVKALLDQRVSVVGWFRRGVSQQVDLKQLHTESGETVSSWTGFWGKVGGVLLLALGLFVGVTTAFG